MKQVLFLVDSNMKERRIVCMIKVFGKIAPRLWPRHHPCEPPALFVPEAVAATTEQGNPVAGEDISRIDFGFGR